ncbi:hypothetical protein P0D69_28000 [Paraburkholderia sediminicola]|uniref:hypothetical protein n=1 Tax=Paraburkholderia sediminicola TaxID=458836 RepID=UPI0038B6E463
MNLVKLVNWIDTHDRPLPTTINGDGTLTVFSVEVTDGHANVVSDVIPATLNDARNLLGY